MLAPSAAPSSGSVVAMENVLRSADVAGTACQFVARGASLDDILQQAGQHAVEDHGLTVTPELVEAVTTPPDDLVRLTAEPPRTEDFAELPSLKPP